MEKLKLTVFAKLRFNLGKKSVTVTVITVPIDVKRSELFFKNRLQQFFYEMNKYAI